MMLRLVLCFGFLFASLAGPADAATGTRAAAPRPAAGAGKRATVPKPAARDGAPEASPRSTGAASTRTLDDIHIEGEIAVPQVLFITARDQRRFMDFQHRRYLRTSWELGESTIFPSRIAVIMEHATHARKESSR